MSANGDAATAVPLPWAGERTAYELAMASGCTRCGAPRGMPCVRSTHEEQWGHAAREVGPLAKPG